MPVFKERVLAALIMPEPDTESRVDGKTSVSYWISVYCRSQEKEDGVVLSELTDCRTSGYGEEASILYGMGLSPRLYLFRYPNQITLGPADSRTNLSNPRYGSVYLRENADGIPEYGDNRGIAKFVKDVFLNKDREGNLGWN